MDAAFHVGDWGTVADMAAGGAAGDAAGHGMAVRALVHLGRGDEARAGRWRALDAVLSAYAQAWALSASAGSGDSAAWDRVIGQMEAALREVKEDEERGAAGVVAARVFALAGRTAEAYAQAAVVALPEAQALLVPLLLRIGRADLARRKADKIAASSEPYGPLANLVLAEVLLHEGRAEEAAAALQDVSDSYGRSASHFARLAACHVLAGDLSAAERALESGQRLGDAGRDASAALAALAATLGAVRGVDEMHADGLSRLRSLQPAHALCSAVDAQIAALSSQSRSL